MTKTCTATNDDGHVHVVEDDQDRRRSAHGRERELRLALLTSTAGTTTRSVHLERQRCHLGDRQLHLSPLLRPRQRDGQRPRQLQRQRRQRRLGFLPAQVRRHSTHALEGRRHEQSGLRSRPLELLQPLRQRRRPALGTGQLGGAGRLPRRNRPLPRQEDPGRARVRLRDPDHRPGRKRLEADHRRRPAQGADPEEDVLHPAGSARSDPALAEDARRRATTTCSSSAARSGSSLPGRAPASSRYRRAGPGPATATSSRPGKYRWYAWAGIGRRSFARYNRIGSARFIVPPG